MQPLRSCSPKRREGGINMPRRSIGRPRPVAMIALTQVSTDPARPDTPPPLRMMNVQRQRRRSRSSHQTFHRPSRTPVAAQPPRDVHPEWQGHGQEPGMARRRPGPCSDAGTNARWDCRRRPYTCARDDDGDT